MTTTADLIAELGADLKAAYDAVEEMGGTVPIDKNAENLPDAIASIPQPSTPPYDPANPTLTGLKAAINAGDYDAFSVGTEIPDNFDGESNPLIVVQYLDSTNNSAYGGAVGAILLRKYLTPGYAFATQVNRGTYSVSLLRSTLNSDEYMSKCSDELLSIVSPLTLPTWTWPETVYVGPDKFFPPSRTEVLAYYSGTSSGVAYQYFIDKNGSASPTSGAVSWRRFNTTGTDFSTWLRDTAAAADTSVISVLSDGRIVSTRSTNSTSYGTLVACFIAKDN